MPEVQKNDQTNSETTQRFIEFVMMQAQQAMLCLGRIPYPATGETMVNLEAAQMFINHLELLTEKTKGNLTKDEESVLSNVLSELKMGFVQTSKNPPETTSGNVAEPEKKEASSSEKIEAPSKEKEEDNSDDESKKRFSKSYGA